MLGHEFGRRDLAFLEVAVGGAFFHGAEAAHARITLKRGPSSRNDSPDFSSVPAARAHHHALGAGGERFTVTRVLDPAVRDHRDVPPPPPVTPSTIAVICGTPTR